MFAPEQAMRAQRESKGTALSFNLGARWWLVVKATPGRFTLGNSEFDVLKLHTLLY